ncbi:hypothetical protein BDV12DRAFT_203050 [Aspergillus spectabilis]
MTATVVSATQAVPNMTPDYEVRLLLNPTAVLSSERELTDTVLSTFNMPLTITKLNLQFLDTCPKEFYTGGWSTRLRKTENERAGIRKFGNKQYVTTITNSTVFNMSYQAGLAI